MYAILPPVASHEENRMPQSFNLLTLPRMWIVVDSRDVRLAHERGVTNGLAFLRLNRFFGRCFVRHHRIANGGEQAKIKRAQGDRFSNVENIELGKLRYSANG